MTARLGSTYWGQSFPGLALAAKASHRDCTSSLTRSAAIPMLAEPTPDQHRAFDLIGSTIPLTIAA